MAALAECPNIIFGGRIENEAGIGYKYEYIITGLQFPYKDIPYKDIIGPGGIEDYCKVPR